MRHFKNSIRQDPVSDPLVILSTGNDESDRESTKSNCCYQIDTTQPEVISQVIDIPEVNTGNRTAVEYNRLHFRKMWHKVEDSKK